MKEPMELDRAAIAQAFIDAAVGVCDQDEEKAATVLADAVAVCAVRAGFSVEEVSAYIAEIMAEAASDAEEKARA